MIAAAVFFFCFVEVVSFGMFCVDFCRDVFLNKN